MTISLFFSKWWPWCCPDDDQKQNDTGPQLANTLPSSYCPHDIVSRSIIFATKKLWLLISTKPHSQRDHPRPSLPGNSELSMPKFLLHAGPLWPAKVPWLTLFVALRATFFPGLQSLEASSLRGGSCAVHSLLLRGHVHTVITHNTKTLPLPPPTCRNLPCKSSCWEVATVP